MPEDRVGDGAAANPEEDAVSDERHERLRRALATLPEDQAQVVQMHYFQFRSSREIAAATGLPAGTVKSRLRLALTRLRGYLKE